MKRKIRVAMWSVLSLALVFVSCKKNNPEPEPEPTPTPTPTNCNVVEVNPTGIAVTISTPTTWTAGNVYAVTSKVTVTSVLTIEAGAIIKLDVSGGFEVINSGKISANGTSSQHITFTSIKDDTYCGDSNGDGTATGPLKGDWQNIYLNGGTNNSFAYCDILYSGRSDYNAVEISVAGPIFTFDHCTFAHTLSSNSSSGAYVFHGGSYMSDPSVSVFTNNVFYDNDRPLYCSFDYTVNTNNSFHNPANVNQKNTRNGIFMWGGIGASVSYNVSEVPYVFMTDFSGGGSAAVRNVNIGNNVVLKFMSSSWGISRGTNNHINLGSGVVFTSYKDDANGGDTNGDGNSSNPAVGDWNGFWDYASNSYVSGSYILYAAN
ncbi:hypothetical protein [Fluviicola taffensis]|uniref:Uncharacterized protein n=1 Tax=Fluviicola taffensis (strain DSM 16823 / NCIMB 13979 / RW262) TaxID=755732 RepID=F2IJC5_FLUTR|nr:hypothetical protein [Fluviicola taffensis]AEA46022.1 hypothetical protein Fluta_4060 [Fluviicola taffensis DSM 16823]